MHAMFLEVSRLLGGCYYTRARGPDAPASISCDKILSVVAVAVICTMLLMS
jgi:hypothetical protein